MPDRPVCIANHYSAPLSNLDLRMVRAVPPGGNWKDIPESVPSRRVAQIRESYAAGGGSRSTYYGRLTPTEPAYTITTYFNRPGNGCYVHPDYDGGQHRLISQREAARLQSFPDSFVFYGSRTSVNKQIGNAVPPLLAYQIALQLGDPGAYVDLFCGAGGLSLGFLWGGWTPLVAVEIDSMFLKTYRHNVHSNAIQADLAMAETLEGVVEAAKSAKRRRPLIVLGGPPCQGFSTAGKRRSMADARNQLFRAYATVLQRLQPDQFVFENVPGLLNMEQGDIYDMVCNTLSSAGYHIATWDIHAHHYAVPQRRRRLFLLGALDAGSLVSPPAPTTSMQTALFDSASPRCVTVDDAIGDLPPVQPGEDGSGKCYISPARTPYQQFVRGEISPAAFLASMHQAQ